MTFVAGDIQERLPIWEPFLLGHYINYKYLVNASVVGTTAERKR